MGIVETAMQLINGWQSKPSNQIANKTIVPLAKGLYEQYIMRPYDPAYPNAPRLFQGGLLGDINAQSDPRLSPDQKRQAANNMVMNIGMAMGGNGKLSDLSLKQSQQIRELAARKLNGVNNMTNAPFLPEHANQVINLAKSQLNIPQKTFSKMSIDQLLSELQGLLPENKAMTVDDMPNLLSKTVKLDKSKYYHGSADRFSSFDPVKIGGGVGWNDQGSGVYLTDSKEAANMFSNIALRNKIGDYSTNKLGEVMDVMVKPNTKIFDFDNYKPTVADAKNILRDAGLREDTVNSISSDELIDNKRLLEWLGTKQKKPIRWLAEKLGYQGIKLTDPRFSSFVNEPGGWLSEYGKKPDSIKTILVFDPKNAEIIK